MSAKRWSKTMTGGIAAVAALSMVLSGCGGKEKTEGAADANGNKKESISVSVYDRGQIPKEEGTYADNRWTKWINENGPVNAKFVPIPRNESQQKYSMLFASGDAPDLVLEYDTDFLNSLWSQKQLLPLDDLIAEHSTEYKALLEKVPALKTLGTKPDGKLYEIGMVTKPEVLGAMVIRQDWLDKLGLQVPQTMDELYAVADAFANQDPDGNGVKDTFGINLSQFATYYIDAMFQNEMFIIQDDQLIRQFDRIKPAYDFKKKLFEGGIVDKDFLSDKNGQKAEQDFASGKLGIYLAYRGVISKNFDTLKNTDPNAKVTAMAFPESEFGRFGPDFNPAIQMTGAVNANAKNPEAVMKYIDFMVTPSTVETLTNGIEGENYAKESDGSIKPIDEKKNETQMGYLNDYRMFMPKYILESNSVDGRMLNSTDPIDKEWLAVSAEMDKLYLDPEHPHPGFTHAKFRPSLDKAMTTTFNDGWNNMNDTMAKAIVSGDAYTVDQGVEDVKKSWYASGGQALEDWYKQWYQDNKDSWIFMKDLYTMKFE
ncbi:ABC transporter substrate-binding protein [Saccharibacillus sp. O23]|uniref:extracellular solute-binding protein n=1 Tax=Saccharibacillus sp. O23 TaxID=2009338 RepID=UPI000B4E834F|nr:extracellular solute-binding protein [Saccharibacillus sp. O23]OWR31422.1 ABC transporter substrate-binding protein [Saccharibacillus sp. O23]